MDCGAEEVGCGGGGGVEGKRRGSEIPSQSRAALGTREVTRGLADEGGCLPRSSSTFS